jgi:hypothetical protein
MGICVPCFERDIAGALGLHRAVVQHIRPEIIGFVLGALIAAHFFSEFKARAGSVDDAARFDRAPVRGAAFAHNFALAGRPDNFAEGLLGGMGHCGMAAVVLGLIVCVMIGFTMTIGPKV